MTRASDTCVKQIHPRNYQHQMGQRSHAGVGMNHICDTLEEVMSPRKDIVRFRELSNNPSNRVEFLQSGVPSVRAGAAIGKAGERRSGGHKWLP